MENNLVSLTLPIFYDGYPDDWLQTKKVARWHTLASMALPNYSAFQATAHDWKQHLPNQVFEKWRGKVKYRGAFAGTLGKFAQQNVVWLNAVSYREDTIRSAKSELASALGIGFTDEVDHLGRATMVHEFVNFHGGHRIDRIENITIPLLVLAWFILVKSEFYRKMLKADLGVQHVVLQIICDHLSGDNPTIGKRTNELALRNLLNPNALKNEIYLTTQGEVHDGNFIVDNLAGYLGECLERPSGLRTNQLLQTDNLEAFLTWREMRFENGQITLAPVIPQLRDRMLIS